MDRIININKPKGMTSHDVVYKVRRILNTKKVGHTGTLDPDACGVLPICIGRATKLSSLLLEKDKVYVCKMKVGIERYIRCKWKNNVYIRYFGDY